jgi:hypothetical protein
MCLEITTAAMNIDKTYNYSPSVNIVRDQQSSLQYITTYNSEAVYGQIKSSVAAGVRSFTIVGAYGTGKSVFLWALQKHLTGEARYFEGDSEIFQNTSEYDFVDFVGEYTSLVRSFEKAFNADGEHLLASIKAKAADLKKLNKALIIRVDEFGKYLEYAAQHNPEVELYFMQQLAELANDRNQNILLFTVLHQDFSAYAYTLSTSQRKEWEKVKGRYKEITFNEPVEQLLFLASARLKEVQYDFPVQELKLLHEAIERATIFPLKDYFSLETSENLLPIDILAASVLTLALQRYGQNERSLFSFIELNDHLSIREFIEEPSAPLYNLVSVYDYLKRHFYSFLSTKYNPDYTNWTAIKGAIERVEGELTENVEESIKLIKLIGILNIFSTKSAKINNHFLASYASITLEISNTQEVLDTLAKRKIIRYVEIHSSYKIFEGTDLDIELAIDEAGQLVEKVRNVSKYLNEHLEFPYASAKAYQYQKGTPRYFEFKLTEEPIAEEPAGEIDGFINLVFSESITSEEVQIHSADCKEAILFVLFKNASHIKQLVHEIIKIERAIQEHAEDKVAVKEFKLILTHQKSLLHHYVLDKIYTPDKNIEFYFGGHKKTVQNRRSFNKLLSEICNSVYHATPTYLNEMVNKTKLSSQIATARKSLIKNVLDNSHLESLGYSDNHFPPDKTIYLSLLKETGIHRVADSKFGLFTPTDESYNKLWSRSEEFLESCRHNKRPLSDYIKLLTLRPFKLKAGFVDFWLPVFLILKKDEFALFGKDGYLPYITPETLDLVVKKPKDYEIKSLDVGGIRLEVFNKYRELISLSETPQATNASFIETVKPFLSFYRGLNTYAKNTSTITKKAQALRLAIANAREPEKVFFEDFPQALGYTLEELNKDQSKLEEYFDELRGAIKEIRTSYNHLQDRFESYIKNEIVGQDLSFEELREAMTSRYNHLKQYALVTYQKALFQRLTLPLETREAWLNSLSQAVLQKSLEQLIDEEEPKLYDKFRELIHSLDNLIEISHANTADQDQLFKVEVTSFLEGVQQKIVRIPKAAQAKANELENKLKGSLSSDRELNIAILTQLLKDQFKND